MKKTQNYTTYLISIYNSDKDFVLIYINFDSS